MVRIQADGAVRAVVCSAALCLLAGACRSAAPTPVRFATTRGSAEPMAFLDSLFYVVEAAPFSEVQSGINRRLRRPTQFMTLEPDQIQAHLASGHIQFAFVDKEDEAAVTAADAGAVIASPVFNDAPPVRTALFVAPTASQINSLADCAGKVIAFGPPNHPVLHWAALRALEDAGVSEQDLAKQVVPIPGSLQFHLSSFEAAKAALFIEADVGVVDEAAFLSWPETGGNVVFSALSLSISRDQLKIVGRTAPLMIFPDGPVVASHLADPELVDKVQHYLTDDLPRNKRITAALGLERYVPSAAVPSPAE